MSGVRTSIYLGDELLANARLLEINVSEVCQVALAAAIEAKVAELHTLVNGAQAAQSLLLRLDGSAVSIGEHATA